MAIPRLTMSDFSQRDGFTNVNEALTTLNNARKVYEPLRDARKTKQQNLADIAIADLQRTQSTGINQAIQERPDYFRQNIQNEEDLRKSQINRNNEMARISVENANFRNSEIQRRNALEAENRKKEKESALISTFDSAAKNPQLLSRIPVEDKRLLLGLTSGAPVPATISDEDVDLGLQTKASQAADLLRKQTQHGEAVKLLNAQGRMSTGNIEQDIAAASQLTPKEPSITTKTTVRTLPDGRQQEVVFDNMGREISAIDKGLAKKEGGTASDRINDKLVDSYAKGFQDRQQKIAEAESSLALIESNLKNQFTGPAGGLYQTGASVFGDPTKDAVSGIANNMAINLRAAGTGALSNRDMDLLLAQVPSIWNAKEANEELVKRFKIATQAIKNRDSIIPTLLEKGMTFPQADALYRQYAEQVPLTKEVGDRLEMVKDRPTFEQWAASNQSSQSVSQPIQTFEVSAEEVAEIPELTPEQARNVPLGTLYRGTDGITRRR